MVEKPTPICIKAFNLFGELARIFHTGSLRRITSRTPLGLLHFLCPALIGSEAA
jgi:hypothetical protein